MVLASLVSLSSRSPATAKPLAHVLADFVYKTVVFEPLTLRSVFLPRE